MKELKQKYNMKLNMKNIFLEKSEKQFNQLGIPRFKKYLSLFRMGVETKKSPPTSFSPVTSTNVRTGLQNFLTFSFNLFATPE